jgi:hypothetical protein
MMGGGKIMNAIRKSLVVVGAGVVLAVVASPFLGNGTDVRADVLKQSGTDIRADVVKENGTDVRADVLKENGTDVRADVLKDNGTDVRAEVLKESGTDIRAQAPVDQEHGGALSGAAPAYGAPLADDEYAPVEHQNGTDGLRAQAAPDEPRQNGTDGLRADTYQKDSSAILGFDSPYSGTEHDSNVGG